MMALIILSNFGIKSALNSFYFKPYNISFENSSTFLLADSHGYALGNFPGDTVANLSMNSDSYLDMKRKVEYLIEKTKCEKIILSVDNHTLSPYRDRSNNLDRSLLFKPRESYNNWLDYFWNRYIRYNLVILNPKQGNLLKQYIKSKIKPGNLQRINWSFLSKREKENIAHKRFEQQFNYSSRSLRLEEALKTIIHLCEINNIELIGVKFPLSPVYEKLVRSKNFKADSIFLSKGIKVMELSHLFKNEKFFKDPDHLNSDGSRVFKQVLLNSTK
ncbi:MAG: hypothetical protein ABGW91_02655 [Christiangramia sp.]